MSEYCKHDFHLVIDRGMKEKLTRIEVFQDYKGLSWVIVKILKILAPVLKREHKWGKQQMGKYMPVCKDPLEIRDHVHVYIPDNLYRELKLMHQDLNTYSIAQLVRGFLQFFLGLVDVYKNNVIRELNEICARWLEEEKETRLTSRKFMLQLWKIIRHLPRKNRAISIYKKDFSPFWVLRI